jgi:hypothetical protein
MRNPVLPHPQIDGAALGLQEASDVISANGSVEAGEFLSQRGGRFFGLGHGGSIAEIAGDFPKQDFSKEGLRASVYEHKLARVQCQSARPAHPSPRILEMNHRQPIPQSSVPNGAHTPAPTLRHGDTVPLAFPDDRPGQGQGIAIRIRSTVARCEGR